MRRLPLYFVGLLVADALILSITPEYTPENYLSLTVAVGLITFIGALLLKQSGGAGLFLKLGGGAGLMLAGAAGMRWSITRIVAWYDNFSRYAESPDTEGNVTQWLLCAIIIALIVFVWKAGARDAIAPTVQRFTTYLVRFTQPQVAVSQPRPAATPQMIPVPPPPPARPTALPRASAPAATPQQRALPATSTAGASPNDLLTRLLEMEAGKAAAAFQATARQAKICTACGVPLQGSSNFCSHCGAAVLGTRPEDACEGCGARLLDPRQLFCNMCGLPRTPALPAPSPRVSLPVYKPANVT